MNVGSAQALLNMIGSDNVPSVANVRNCIQSLNKICSCQRQRKAQKSEECNGVYVNFVNSQAPGLLEYFKTKTKDDTIVFTYGSNHEIKRFKLR